MESNGPTRINKSSSKALDLQRIFGWLLADGIVAAAEAKALYHKARGIQHNASAMHPLTAVAQCKLQSAKLPHKLLTLDWLTEWMADKAGLPYLRIDPLKID